MQVDLNNVEWKPIERNGTTDKIPSLSERKLLFNKLFRQPDDPRSKEQADSASFGSNGKLVLLLLSVAEDKAWTLYH